MYVPGCIINTYIIALLIIALNWVCSKCLSSGGWISNLECFHTVEHYAAMKMNKQQLHATISVRLNRACGLYFLCLSKQPVIKSMSTQEDGAVWIIGHQRWGQGPYWEASTVVLERENAVLNLGSSSSKQRMTLTVDRCQK